MFGYILLESLYKLNLERSPAAIYHIITGKRSGQTIQDIHIFRLKNYFGIYKPLLKADFDVLVNTLVKEGKAAWTGNNLFPTEKGLIDLRQEDIKKEVMQFSGLDYDRITDVFFDRLTLFIQLSSNLLSGEKKFLPVTEKKEILDWGRGFYHLKKENMKEWFNQLYDELFTFLDSLNELQASIFVDRLSGFNQYGLSKEQIKVKHHLSIHETNIVMVLIIHKLINFIYSHKKENLFLEEFLAGSSYQSLSTETAEKTYALLNKGYTASEISKIRNLKINTIYDHIIEIAYRYKDFDYHPYISEADFIKITNTANQLESKKLKVLHDTLNEKYTYFQIRLVLAVNDF